MPLDDTDRKILTLLKRDGKMPLKAIAGHVGLARSSVQERIRRLEDDGVIRRYTIETGVKDGGFVSAYLWIRTESALCEKLAPKIVALPEVRHCRSIAGELDMVAFVEGASAARISAIRAEIAGWAGVTGVETHLVLKDWI